MKLRITKRRHLPTQGVITILEITVTAYNEGYNLKRVPKQIKHFSSY